MSTIRSSRVRNKKEDKPKSEIEFFKSAAAEQVEKGGPGRPPIYDEPRKIKGFNIPISMIEEVNECAKKNFQGNASALAEKALREFLDKYK